MQIPQTHLAQANLHSAASSDRASGFEELNTFDPSEFELALKPWELMAQPLAAGQFRHSISMLRAKDFFLYREDYALSMTLFGLSPSGMLGFGVPLVEHGNAKYWGIIHGNTSCPMVLSGPLEATWRGTFSQVVAFVDIEILRMKLTEREFEKLMDLAAVRRADLEPRTRKKLANFLKLVLHECSVFRDRAIGEEFQDIVRDELVAFLALIAGESCDRVDKPSSAVRIRALRRACEFLIDAGPKQVAMSDLCQIAEASERTLQYAFREEIGMPIRDFLMVRRLHAARRCLLHADPSITSVTDIATENGFFELGRFAGKYHAYFGELPSETLKKR